MTEDNQGFQSELMTGYEVADLLHINHRTLEAWRYLKKGPPYMRIGPGKRSKIVYYRKEVHAWLAKFRTDPSQ